MSFEKGQKYLFKVRGSRRNPSGLYYAIDVNGVDQYVKAYEFQKRQPPTEICCICKGLNEYGKPAFMQDIASLIKQLYKVGDVGDFRIKTQPGNRGYYEVTDENDFCFRLVGYGSEKFYNNQMVRCRITFINLVRVEMELASGYRDVSIPFYDLRQVTDLDDTGKSSPRLFRSLFLSPSFQRTRKQYYEGNPLWVMSALKYVQDRLDNIVQHRNATSAITLLKSYASICRNLLEKSDYLTHAAETETLQYQRELGKMVDRAEDLQQAIELVRSNQQKEFISQIFDRLETSGFLLDFDHPMRVLKGIFLLLSLDSLTETVENLFRVIDKQCQNTRFIRFFSKPLVRLLDIFLCRITDSEAETSCEEDTLTEIIIKAVAIRLLLAENEIDSGQDYRIYQSMLYRYAARLMSEPEYFESLTLKAFGAITCDYLRHAPCSWDDLRDINRFCTRLAHSNPMLSNHDAEALNFTGGGVNCLLDGKRLTLQPAVRTCELSNVIPEGFFENGDITIFLDRDIDAPRNNSRLSILSNFWNEIFSALFNPSEAETKTLRRRLPKVGDDVMVRVLGPTKGNPSEFVCRIEEEEYWGTGTIVPSKQIVSYNVKVTANSFIDRMTGKPYLLKARVERIDANGNISFSMRPGIAEFNTETLDSDVKNLVVVSRVDPHQYLCITRGGVTMFIPRDDTTPQLRLNDYLVADIISIFEDGNVQGSICGRAYETFDRAEAFNNLVTDYADGQLYEGPAEANDTEVFREIANEMSPMFLRELILDYLGLANVYAENEWKYSYMALARILAHIGGFNKLAEAILRRQSVLTAVTEMVERGSIDSASLNTIMSDPDALTGMPVVEHLCIAGSLDDKQAQEFLMNCRLSSPNAVSRQLASLVLAHNLISEGDNPEIRTLLRKNIQELLEPERHQ